jgi:hypothetical protein
MVDLGGWKLLSSMEMELVPNTTTTVQLSITNPVCSVSPSCSPLVLTLLVNIKSERPSVTVREETTILVYLNNPQSQ